MDPFIGEIRMLGFNFAPKGWALCNGQMLPITQNTALFSILGVTWGGDGKSTFGLPNFQGSVPVGAGQGAGLSVYAAGQSGGEQTVTLTSAQVAPHGHRFSASAGDGNSQTAAGSLFATGVGIAQYAAPLTLAPLSPNMLAPVGNGQAHNNMMPYCTLLFAIALNGVYPPRS